MEYEGNIEFIEWDEFLENFRWKQGEHLTLLGPTGQGKTTLALRLIEAKRKFVVIFATKKRDPLIAKLRKAGYERMSTFISNPNVAEKVILAPPLRKGASSKREQAKGFKDALDSAFLSGGWAIYLDEAQYVCDYLRLSEECELLWRQGRSLGVTMIAGTQRPVNIPLAAYSGATHIFFWRNNDDADLRRVGSLGGLSSKEIREAVAMLPRHEVLYLNTRTGSMARTKVKLR